MPLNVAFLMEPMDQVNPEKSSSLVIMEEAQARGHTVYHFSPNEITLSPETVFAKARKVKINSGQEDFYSSGEDELINLLAVDIVFMRQDPPFNMEYVTTTYMLEAIDNQTLVINHPVSVRNAPEKIFPFVFREYIPPTVITEDIGAVKSLLETEEKIVLKPLYMYGGTDVFLVSKKNDSDLEKHFDYLIKTYQAPIVAQKFIDEVKDGDKRILFIDGEVQGAFLRIPEEGSIRANLMSGGSLHKAELNDHEKEICEKISPLLKEREFMICGIDIVGRYLTEINVTSPIGFVEFKKLYDINPAIFLWDRIEEKLKNAKSN